MKSQVILLCFTVFQLAWLHSAEITSLRPDRQNGFANACWYYDTYPDLPRLTPLTTTTVADLQGPGIIRCIHLTGHSPELFMARGLVLEIWFDNALSPNVAVPLADFFADGSNGRGTTYTTDFVEKVPRAYNCYIPMPFAVRAVVKIRNDTTLEPKSYIFIEWEKASAWDPNWGSFYATYERRRIELHEQATETVFSVQGRGFLVGRQYTLHTNEPDYDNFSFIMEGNHEVGIDGSSNFRMYSNTEESFGFSSGDRDICADMLKGIVVSSDGTPDRISLYNFYDAPIHFEQELTWRINWQNESSGPHSGILDIATVHYWYMNQPGLYQHAAIESLAYRVLDIMPSGPLEPVEPNFVLLGHWRFDDNPGSAVAVDSTNHHYDGIVLNGQFITSGYRGGALRLNGNGSRVTAAEQAVSDTGITVAGWIKPDAINREWQILASQWNDQAPEYDKYFFHFNLKNRNLELYLSYDGNDYYKAKEALNVIGTNQWTHVAFTIECGGPVRLYVNGNEVNAETSVSSLILPDVQRPFIIGNKENGGAATEYKGLVDDWAIWDYALSPEQIVTVKNTGL